MLKGENERRFAASKQRLLAQKKQLEQDKMDKRIMILNKPVHMYNMKTKKKENKFFKAARKSLREYRLVQLHALMNSVAFLL